MDPDRVCFVFLGAFLAFFRFSIMIKFGVGPCLVSYYRSSHKARGVSQIQAHDSDRKSEQGSLTLDISSSGFKA